jgi:uncharacterized protein (TIGR00725 family)
MKISIFGSSQPQAGSPAYVEAYNLGKTLAEAGHIVITGGYIGTMEAASRGAFEAGGHVIGVTCADIEAWRKVKPNEWVKEEHRFNTLQERLTGLIESCDAAMALPGGPGTLTEIALTWNLMVIQAIPIKPLILIGESWEKVFIILIDSFQGNIPADQRSLVSYAKNSDDAIALLSKFINDNSSR